jgi:hypothetical protein
MRLLFLLAMFSLSGLWASGQDCTRIASSYRGAVVSITVDVKETTTGKPHEVRNGTGFIITSNGVVLTTNNVVEADPAVYSVTIKGSAGSYYGYKSPLELIGKSKERGIALLRFLDDSSTYKTVPLGDPWSVRPGQRLCSLGFPAAPQDQLLNYGTLSSINGRNSLWVTDLPWNKGEEGAPVFDLATSMVVAMKVGTLDKVNYLNPINLARSLIEDYTRLRLPVSDPQQSWPPALLCVENPGDTRNSVDTTVEAECEGLNKKTAHSRSWRLPSASTKVDGVSASAEAAVELKCEMSQGDYVLGLTARHSSMAGVGGASDDYRPSVSTIKGAAVTGFTVERGNYCLALTQYVRNGERKKGYLESEYFPEGLTRPTLIVLEAPTGRLIKLQPGISIPLDATGFWRFKIEINTAHSSGSREDSGHITMENLLRFKFSSRVQGGECPSLGDNLPSK